MSLRESKQKACSEANRVSSRELREEVSQETYQGTEELSTDDDAGKDEDDAGKDDDDAGKDASSSENCDAAIDVFSFLGG